MKIEATDKTTNNTFRIKSQQLRKECQGWSYHRTLTFKEIDIFVRKIFNNLKCMLHL